MTASRSNALFVCSRDQWRNSTAELIWRDSDWRAGRILEGLREPGLEALPMSMS